mgnify:FL=1
MNLEKRIQKRNKGLKTVKTGTVAATVGGIACTGVIAVGMASSSGALSATVEPSAIVETPAVVSPAPTAVDHVTKIKQKKAKKPTSKTQASAKIVPKPAPQQNQQAAKSHGS